MGRAAPNKPVLLTEKEIVWVHNKAVQHYGGLPSRTEPGRLSPVVSRVRNLELYEGVSDIFTLAAMYCVAIARAHLFADGNKRTSMNSMMLFLKRNGIRPHMVDDLEERVISAATGELTAPELADWLRRNYSRNDA
ncbi:type II toxin-antitoxin system death-on-curing family toxin [Sutterella sp.]|uniref:type II toxin-antitoxin system death-on-curing family toxin n=1 Tax=Sutterella sp. TaxID=1981025 RepID=UPI0026DF4C55|nr:type II toxin-antitoxin system death-on-curing family toxin [Sutterella sp.]MDO5531883.1 type II toxin-antitoxin system death-on-curing family toxin [Sutterella sp.]